MNQASHARDFPCILVVNCGSSSLKFSLLELPAGRALASGNFERLGTPEAQLTLKAGGGERVAPQPDADHHAALERIVAELKALGLPLERITGVGHRVVHGGEKFSRSVRVDEAALETIRGLSDLAPLHNPANAEGIEVARQFFPGVPHVAVFDTAFHQTMPPRAFHYAIPHRLYRDYGVRRYGFHGTSHAYVAGEAAAFLDRPLEEVCLVTAHLGNGCSATAVREGRSVDTTMGLTPLEGLVMGTRSGDVDPSLHAFLAAKTGQSLEEITSLLNRESGLLGLSECDNDMRALLEARSDGNQRAALAIEVFCYRLARSILALCAGLPRLDAVVFTGGIGENSPDVRAETLTHLALLGGAVDPAANACCVGGQSGAITLPDSRLLALVIPTNEELRIARETAELLPSCTPSI